MTIGLRADSHAKSDENARSQGGAATCRGPRMNDYQPPWRRPIAQTFRRTAYVSVDWCVKLGIHPNLVSYSSMLASAGASVCFWQAGAVPGLLLVAVGFCYLRLWLNML